MRKSRKISNPGFTLIEVLVVMGIILILAGIVVGVQRGVYHKQSQAKARGEMQAIATALESYKLKYGDYPWLGDDTGGTGLFLHLTGQQVMRPKSGTNAVGVQMVDVDELVARPVIAADKLKVAETSSGREYFQDPWGNAYRYYYIDSSATPNDDERLGPGGWADWDQPGFLLISVGADGQIGSTSGTGTDLERGQLASNYHEASDDNLDNIVHGREY